MTNPHDSTSYISAEDMQTFTASPGLTKREYFAALAMQGILANPEEYSDTSTAQSSVEMADALIAALNAEVSA